MNRIAAALAVAGFALITYALWSWNEASSDQKVSESICRLGDGPCDASMSWGPTIITGILGVAAIIAAWRLARSGVDERPEKFVD